MNHKTCQGLAFYFSFLPFLFFVFCFILPSSAKADSLYYIHQDHLSSTNLVTNQDGEIISRQNYYPYGSTRTNQGSIATERQYTSQISDQDQTRLYYYNARYYDPKVALFSQADVVEGPNRYVYVNSNPINFIDASGAYPQRPNQFLSPEEVVSRIENVESMLEQGNHQYSAFGTQRGTLIYGAAVPEDARMLYPKNELDSGPKNVPKYLISDTHGVLDLQYFFCGAEFRGAAMNWSNEFINNWSGFDLLARSIIEINEGREFLRSLFNTKDFGEQGKFSSYSYEDMASYKMGVIFGKEYFNTDSDVSEQLAQFFKDYNYTDPRLVKDFQKFLDESSSIKDPWYEFDNFIVPEFYNELPDEYKSD